MLRAVLDWILQHVYSTKVLRMPEPHLCVPSNLTLATMLDLQNISVIILYLGTVYRSFTIVEKL